MANNLKALREQRGWTQDHLAALMGTTRNQLAKLEKGTGRNGRQLSDKWISKAAAAFGCDPADLVRARTSVSVVGLIGASDDGSRITFSESPGHLGEVRLPPNGNEKTVALEVRGSSMRGLAENGWFVYYDRREDGLDESLLGELCVVGLKDGRTLVKTPHKARESGLYDLESWNAPMIRNVDIEWASPVTAIIPRRFAILDNEKG